MQIKIAAITTRIKTTLIIVQASPFLRFGIFQILIFTIENNHTICFRIREDIRCNSRRLLLLRDHRRAAQRHPGFRSAIGSQRPRFPGRKPLLKHAHGGSAPLRQRNTQYGSILSNHRMILSQEKKYTALVEILQCVWPQITLIFKISHFEQIYHDVRFSGPLWSLLEPALCF